MLRSERRRLNLCCPVSVAAGLRTYKPFTTPSTARFERQRYVVSILTAFVFRYETRWGLSGPAEKSSVEIGQVRLPELVRNVMQCAFRAEKVDRLLAPNLIDQHGPSHIVGIETTLERANTRSSQFRNLLDRQRIPSSANSRRMCRNFDTNSRSAPSARTRCNSDFSHFNETAPCKPGC